MTLHSYFLKLFRTFFFGILSCLISQLLTAAELELIPQPQSVKFNGSKPYEFKKSATIFYSTRKAPRELEKSLEPMAKVLSEELELVTGIRPKVAAMNSGSKPSKGDIILRFTKMSGKFAETEPDENQSYLLKVTPAGVIVESAYSKGVSYGTATLIQSLMLNKGRALLPAMTIEDEPAAAYRSVMLDVARKPHSIEVVKQVVRLARLYKLRYVQLHLTDNESFTYPFEPVISKLKGNNHYSREELIDLVAYADARGVTLIPECDLPGHSKLLKESGYLSPSKTDADVADPANYEKIMVMIDDMLGIFSSSPYFHIGGDESAAGSKLVPFLEAVNKHLRGNAKGGKRRMIVWEGFHGAPTAQIPAKGDDRVIVMAWESSYNAPWALLNNGYEIINCSWKPLYNAGGGSGPQFLHNTGGRKFRVRDLFRWEKSIFMHWEPGRPLYEDRGPNDKNKDDGEWDARWIDKDNLILGAQFQFWEQRQNGVMMRLPDRLATMAHRLWNPKSNLSFEQFKIRLDKVMERVLTIVQPVLILPKGDSEANPLTDLYQPYKGESLDVTFVNRTRIKGTIRYTHGPFIGDLNRVEFKDGGIPQSSDKAAQGQVNFEGGFILCAKLFREDGTPVEGVTWKWYNNWPDRINVTDYDIGRKSLKKVIDLAKLPEEKVLRRFNMPYLRGPLQHIEVKGQMLVSILTAEEEGDHTFLVKTRVGACNLYLDLNQNGKWDKSDLVIENTTGDEKPKTAIVNLKKGEKYMLRVDHMTAMPVPYINVSITPPNAKKGQNVNKYLSLPSE